MRGEATMDAVLEVARSVAASVQERPGEDNSINATFAKYVGACLTHMPPAVAREKRRLILDILEGY